MHTLEDLNDRLSHVAHLGLFLDYDGTLVDFAPTPDIVEPDPDVITLLAELKSSPRFQIAVISGRKLQQLRILLPVPGILLAGMYGVEIQTETGEIVHRLNMSTIRPALEELKPVWKALIEGHRGYFLEDKGWSLALHARFAPDDEAEQVLESARRLTGELPPTLFRLVEGHKFFEVGPALAHKGQSVEYILQRARWAGVTPLYLGDDARDEEAFGAVSARGGICVIVAQEPGTSLAEFCLSSSSDVRRWLSVLADSDLVTKA